MQAEYGPVVASAVSTVISSACTSKAAASSSSLLLPTQSIGPKRRPLDGLYRPAVALTPHSLQGPEVTTLMLAERGHDRK